MSDRARSAVVLGGSMSGLLTARVLANHFQQVTIVERDELGDRPEPRKGVPQSAHAHGVLASGYRVIDAYFPGLMDELDDAGAPRGDVVGDYLWFQYGRWKLRHDSGLRGICVSRPGLETAIRRRVRALPNVTVLDRTSCVTPVFDRVSEQVSGVIVERPLESTPAAQANVARRDTLRADLVVDATGRGSQTPKWLAEWGFAPPQTLAVRINVGYATRVFERRPGEFFNSTGAIVSGTPPSSTRYAAVLAAEGRRWLVTLAGSVGDYPPTDEDGWIRFAASLPVPVVHDLVTSARPLSDIASFRFPANQRRLYERLTRFPGGYLVCGDAVCSFNPIYGQGMSVAAAEAQALDESLADGVAGLAARFYARARRLIDIPWLIATGEDLRFPQVEGRRPLGSGVINRYFDRVHAAASVDPVVCRKFFDVLNLLAPPTSLMTPALACRVLARPAPQSQGSPWGAIRPEFNAAT